MFNSIIKYFTKSSKVCIESQSSNVCIDQKFLEVDIEKLSDVTHAVSHIFDEKETEMIESNIQINHNYLIPILNNIFPEVISKLILLFIQYDFEMKVTFSSNNMPVGVFCIVFNIQTFTTFSIMVNTNEFITIKFVDLPFINTSLVELTGAPYHEFMQKYIIGMESFFDYYMKQKYSIKLFECDTCFNTICKDEKYITTSGCTFHNQQNNTKTNCDMVYSIEVLDHENLLLLIFIIDKFINIISDAYAKKIE